MSINMGILLLSEYETDFFFRSGLLELHTAAKDVDLLEYLDEFDTFRKGILLEVS
jgi:hypothetical protein